MNATRQNRMSFQVMDEPITSTVRYLIQVKVRGEYWRTTDQAFSTPEAARQAALDGNSSPVPLSREWRIVRSVSTWETVDTSGM